MMVRSKNNVLKLDFYNTTKEYNISVNFQQTDKLKMPKISFLISMVPITSKYTLDDL